jgi:hypothetical protein
MNFKIKKLELECKKSRESIDFSPQITYFYGKMASGKTTIAHLISFCLGGDFDKPPAIKEELLSARLFLSINGREAVFEREADSTNQIKISWEENGKVEGRLAPIEATPLPILGDQVFNTSDLIFYLLGQAPLKVPLGDNFVRLSFRDVMWYCYLKQEQLISNFYNLGENVYREKMLKSRFVMRYLVGLFDEKLYELEKKLHDISTTRKRTLQDIESVSAFLKKFGYGSDQELRNEIKLTESNSNNAKMALDNIRAGYNNDTHFADKLRKELVELTNQITRIEKAHMDLNESIEEKYSLRAELIASKSKLNRSNSAREILEDAKFEFCPSCGSKISNEPIKPDICSLCGQSTLPIKDELIINDIVQSDLKERIKELEESIDRHRIEYESQIKSLAELRNVKKQKDLQLEQALKNYDSKYLSQAREIEKQIATYEERTQNLLRILEMPLEVNRLETQLIILKAKEEKLYKERDEELAKRTTADRIIKELEESYHETLLAINLPNMHPEDLVQINRTTWVPEIVPYDKTRGKWSFFNISSTGMAALLNVCYALAIHKVAARNRLPLPSFLIIDSPARNIDKDVDSKVFDSYYSYLYELANGDLLDTQFILIDNYYAPAPDNVKIIKRYMTRDDPHYPPLISYLLERKS